MRFQLKKYFKYKYFSHRNRNIKKVGVLSIYAEYEV